jgi:hypothetical protein
VVHGQTDRITFQEIPYFKDFLDVLFGESADNEASLLETTDKAFLFKFEEGLSNR